MSASYQAVSFWAKRAERFNHSISLEKTSTQPEVKWKVITLCFADRPRQPNESEFQIF